MVDPKQPGDVLQYVSAGEAARKHLAAHKARIKVEYDQKAVIRTFDPGDAVLVLNSGARGQLGVHHIT